MSLRDVARDNPLLAAGRELAAPGDPVTALERVDTSERAAVVPAAERVRQVTERVRPLLAGRESQLPGPMLDGWQRMSGGVRDLGNPERRCG